MLRDLGLGLETRLSSEVSTLSGGQRQALTLLMATLKSPKLLAQFAKVSGDEFSSDRALLS